MIVRLAVAAGEEHPEPELACGMLLLRGGHEPPLRLLEIQLLAETARVLIAEARLRGRVSCIRSGAIPVRRLLEVLGDRKPPRIEPLQERLLTALRGALLDQYESGRCYGAGRCHSDEVDLAEPSHRLHRALLGCAFVPAHRLD